MSKMSRLILIAAMSDNRVIGRDGQIPWRIPEDLKRFRELTIGHPVIMGRKTYESIPERYRPLSGRTNIVVSGTSRNYEGAIVCSSINEALEIGRKDKKVDCYVAGGSLVYEQTLSWADRLELTEVHRYIEGEARFPHFDRGRWKEVFRESHGEFSFVNYESSDSR